MTTAPHIMATQGQTASTKVAEKRSPWIISAPFDLAVILGPLALALGALALIQGFQVQEPMWAYLMFFVAFDVAHVWGTIYITYLDPELFKRRKLLYLLPIPLCFAASFGLHMWSSTTFWTAIAYFAIYHFAKQQYGFIAIYKAKAGERDPIDYRLDKAALWMAALGPVLLWHSTPRGQFDWFGSGEAFLVRFPQWVQVPIFVVWASVGVAYVVRQVWVWKKYGRVNVGKNVWMGAAWLSWYVGIRLADHLFISAAFLNLMHGIPYMALIWRRCNVRWEGRRGEGSSAFVGWLSQRKHWLWFYLVVFVIAVVEEVLWDGLVWGKYLPDALGVSAPTLGAVALSFWVALLSLPQIVHYVLDGFLWKVNADNPELKDALFGPPDPSQAQAS